MMDLSCGSWEDEEGWCLRPGFLSGGQAVEGCLCSDLGEVAGFSLLAF
jgi:hypothetical protein